MSSSIGIVMQQASVKPSPAFDLVEANPALESKCAPAVTDQVISSTTDSFDPAVTKANPWALMTDADFSMKKGKLTGKWNFNDLLGLERPDFSGEGQYKSFRSGPQNDPGCIGAGIGSEGKIGGDHYDME